MNSEPTSAAPSEPVDEAMEVFELKRPDDKKFRRWMGLSVVSKGQLFVSPMLAGMDEQEAIMCCSFDGQPVMREAGITLVPAEWLAKERPDFVELHDKITLRIKEAREREGVGSPT